MKVALLTEGGRSIGYGHVTRCLSIAQAFVEKGLESNIFIHPSDNNERFTDPHISRTFNWLEETHILTDIIEDASIIIIDSYLAKPDDYEKIATKARTLASIDDFNRINYPQGVVINGAIGASSLPYPDNPLVTYLLEQEYQPVRKAFWNLPDRDVKPEIEQILITMGGVDIRNLSPGIVMLLQNEFPDLKKSVVLGRGYQAPSGKDIRLDRNTEIYSDLDMDQMAQLMIQSDICISAAGQTMYELACAGLPTIAIQVAENQALNIKGFEKAGFAVNLGNWDAVTREKIVGSIENSQTRGIREQMKNAGKKLIDGNGSRRIAEYLLNLVE